MVAISHSARKGRPPKPNGVAAAIAHHGELLQGSFEDENGHLHRGLVTLPLATMRSRATFVCADAAAVTVKPKDKLKAAAAARLTLDHLNVVEGGTLHIDSDIPIGHGYGSSTADVVASIRAVAAAYAKPLTPHRVCKIAVAAEHASDAIAFDDHAILFAQREGVVLEDFGGALPPLLVVGAKANASRPIDTLELPAARYDESELQQFRVLRGLIAYAVRHQDPVSLGHAATASALISQRRLPKQHLDRAMTIAESAGACGIQVAHSGSLLGVLFDRTGKDLRQRARHAALSLHSAGFTDVDIHQTHDDGL